MISDRVSVSVPSPRSAGEARFAPTRTLGGDKHRRKRFNVRLDRQIESRWNHFKHVWHAASVAGLGMCLGSCALDEGRLGWAFVGLLWGEEGGKRRWWRSYKNKGDALLSNHIRWSCQHFSEIFWHLKTRFLDTFCAEMRLFTRTPRLKEHFISL